MSRRKVRHPHDPRGYPGAMVGDADDSHGRGMTIIDARRALLLQQLSVVALDNTDPDREINYGLMLSGRINRTPEQVDLLVIANTDAVAAILTQLIALLGRAKGREAVELVTLVEERLAELRAAGAMS